MENFVVSSSTDLIPYIASLKMHLKCLIVKESEALRYAYKHEQKVGNTEMNSLFVA